MEHHHHLQGQVHAAAFPKRSRAQGCLMPHTNDERHNTMNTHTPQVVLTRPTLNERASGQP